MSPALSPGSLEAILGSEKHAYPGETRVTQPHPANANEVTEEKAPGHSGQWRRLRGILKGYPVCIHTRKTSGMFTVDDNTSQILCTCDLFVGKPQ